MADKHRAAQPTESMLGDMGRRRFLGYLIAAPTLAVGARLGEAGFDPEPAAAATLPTPVPEPQEIYDLSDLLLDSTRPTANLITVTLDELGIARLALPRSENGQGVTTMAAMLIAEEMGMPVEDVRVEPDDARPELLFNQQTQGTNTVITQFIPIRVAAALARGRLLEAGAIKLGETATNMRTRGGRVISKTGSSIPFAELATDAANRESREALTQLTRREDFEVIGTPQRRDDIVDAVTGNKTYTTDIDFPEAKPTMVARPPTINGQVESVNNREAVLGMPGIEDVVTISSDASPSAGSSNPTGVAVRGRTFGQCIDAVRALDITWSAGTVDNESDETILAQLRDAAAPFNVPTPPQEGSNQNALDDLAGQLPLASEELANLGPLDSIEDEFIFYWNNNAAMEPNVAVADVRDDSAEIWSPTQVPINTQAQVANALGMRIDQVTVHVVRGGGAFGRRLFADPELEAARISQQTGKPVRLMWHRADECRAGRVHPMSIGRIRATFSESAGQVVSFEQRHTSVSTDYTEVFADMFSSRASQLPFANETAVSQGVFFLTVNVPYDFGAVSQQYNEIFDFDTFHTGSVRNLNNPDVRPAQELMVDRLAARMGKDRLDFRLETLEEERTKKLLETVRDEGQWGRDLPDGVGQGVAVHEEYKSIVAMVVEVDARPETANRKIVGATTGPRVTRVTMAVDPGLVINPSGMRNQLEGALMSGISHVFTGSLHLRDGAFLEASWDDYRYTRHWNTPLDVNIILMPEEGQRVGGAGELATGVSRAAVACAYGAATGTQPTSFPIGQNNGIPFKIKSFQPPIPASPKDGLTAYPAPSAAKGTFNPAEGEFGA